MSTQYDALDPVFSSIREESDTLHCKVSLWSEGKHIGTLIVGVEQRGELLTLFFTRHDVVTRTGNSVSKPVDMRDDTQLLSEYRAELTTLGEVRSGCSVVHS